MSCVLQEWVCKLPWKQQSVLLSGLRGPDNNHCPCIKMVTRWMRNVTQNNADPSHSYMMITNLPLFEELEKELEYTSVHYLHHLAQALKVVSIGHSDRKICAYARKIYCDICMELMHVYPETDSQFDERLRDKVEHA